ncbi:MAG: hypothetical protein K2J84_03735 [Bacteroidaceae bacterium]|nr:hypothetical protein [Bacteroidaceae bacterium]
MEPPFFHAKATAFATRCPLKGLTHEQRHNSVSTSAEVLQYFLGSTSVLLRKY